MKEVFTMEKIYIYQLMEGSELVVTSKKVFACDPDVKKIYGAMWHLS